MATFRHGAFPGVALAPRSSGCGLSVEMKHGLRLVVLFLGLGVQPGSAERINHEGRILGPPPVVANPILFNTTHADAVLAAMQVLPVDNPWNEDISRRPLLPNSDAMIAQISADLASNRRTLRLFREMNFALVPDSQPLMPITFTDYPDESDPSPYPIPSNLPVETWPAETGGMTLSDWQQTDDGSDRHSIIVQPETGGLWETWRTLRVGADWQAANGAKFNLNSNGLRPTGWTSGDAAGLPMFPALVRYDECERGMVEHAMRIVVKRTRREYLYPANHYASTTAASQTNVPAMGQRLRLKSAFNIPANWTKQEKAVLFGLKKYGALVADNGGFFSISITPDDRWPAGCFDHLSSIGITNFEVIQTTGPNEGPRSPGAPAVNAGSDRSAFVDVPVTLPGVVTFSGAPPAIQWKLYSGPGNVMFGNSDQSTTTASFNAPGDYTLILSASDGVHALVCDAVAVTVARAIAAAVSRVGTNVILSWTGGAPPFVVEHSDSLPATTWSGVITTSVHSASVPISTGAAFLRVKGN